ncbi:molecular chaperone GroEL [Roseovarius rhodophyticola]|uniref:Molecular chaperone GroEL n=1 Tax=Roseovarius rhodophyticola TaxID=3080827 RepID=A0ABZ2THL2_9RHOB
MSNALNGFFDAWSETDPAGQLILIAKAVAKNARYADPRTDGVEGVEDIAAYVAQFAQMAPGATAEVIASETRDGVTRATVRFAMPGGMEQLGQYFAETDAARLLTRIVGFKGTGGE